MIIPNAAKIAMVERFRRAPFADKVTAEMLVTVLEAYGVPWHEAFMCADHVLPFLVDYRKQRAPQPEDRVRLRWNHSAGAWRLR